MSTAPATDPRLHFKVVRDVLVGPLGGHIYEMSGVPGRQAAAGGINPGSTPSRYAMLTVERRYAEAFNAVGLPQMSAWRIAVIYVGRFPTDVRTFQALVADALESQRLVIDGRPTRAVSMETPGSPAPDSNTFSARDTFTYAL